MPRDRGNTARHSSVVVNVDGLTKNRRQMRRWIFPSGIMGTNSSFALYLEVAGPIILGAVQADATECGTLRGIRELSATERYRSVPPSPPVPVGSHFKSRRARRPARRLSFFQCRKRAPSCECSQVDHCFTWDQQSRCCPLFSRLSFNRFQWDIRDRLGHSGTLSQRR